jgi:hypothetical protein
MTPIAKRFPGLPPLPRTTAPSGPMAITFDKLSAKLQDGCCAVLNGNPSKVKDAASPLHSMQANSDYDHAIFVHAAGLERAFVMDPPRSRELRGPVGRQGRSAAVRIEVLHGFRLALLRHRQAWSPVERRAAAADPDGTADERSDRPRHGEGGDRDGSSSGPRRRRQGDRGAAPMSGHVGKGGA